MLIGEVEALFRYPVKSMRGEALEAASLGWHGLDGDRRLGLRRVDDRGGFPWLTAGRLPALVAFTPLHREAGELPSHVRTPEGEELPIFGDELAANVGRRANAALQMTHLKHGIFDDGAVSVITSATASEVCRLAETPFDLRRFRPNVVIRSAQPQPFEEDGWLGGILVFGDASDAPAVAVTQRDLRCAMLNIHPDDATLSPGMMKAAVKANENNAGVYGTPTRIGRLVVGQRIYLNRIR